ncbi:DUF2950 domain-containing protein [Trichlorobacter ammonificans]|uniref:DUF2950 domain-containing protein n=1 Tax=Trichlorobacter ammonificans TaxID=2916410 RepID=A0ABN8HFP5_9BACT|nr:DUF2950 domain-containing protein [Trichlorobacter ammonificans]CAH2030250.1 conserved protein of unknown function [Trichlorobacter ammonificans]
MTPILSGRFVSSGLRHGFLLLILAGVLLVTTAATAECRGPGPRQQHFRSPEQAARALVEACRKDDLQALLTILGPGSRQLVASGDGVADNAGRDRFVAAYDHKHRITPQGPTAMILQIGNDDWSLPIPIVRKRGGWAFDIGTGKREMLKRRIGRNELRALELLERYVAAQHDYAGRNRGDNGTVEFAQRLVSSPGRRDGLYWKAQEGEPESPFGPLVAQLTADGYSVTEAPFAPFHGYHFRILTGQGEQAGGGAYPYLVKGRMILGFALVAYPAAYGSSGVMTFLVNQEGIVYEKNLGRQTRRLAEAMTLFNPDSTWRRVQPPEPPANGAATKQP